MPRRLISTPFARPRPGVRPRLKILGLIALAVTLGLSPAQAEENPQAPPTPQQLREASEILGDTWSPFCPGRTLSSCTSGKAAEWREDVRAWLAEGLTREQVMARLQARVPDFHLETIPDAGGIQYGPWVLGGIFLLALAGLVALARRQAHGAAQGTPQQPTTAAPVADKDRLSLNAELDALES